MTTFLARRLKLTVNVAKSAVDRPVARSFLGFSFTGGQTPRRRIAGQAVARFKARVRELTRGTNSVGLSRLTTALSRYLVGWRGYFGFCETPSVLRRLDQWIRRRLRAFVWRQWKRGRTRFAALRRHGVGKDLADRRQPPTLAAQQQPRAVHRPDQRLLQQARAPFIAARLDRLNPSNRRVRPVRTVVWEGRSREAPPYPDCRGLRRCFK